MSVSKAAYGFCWVLRTGSQWVGSGSGWPLTSGAAWKAMVTVCPGPGGFPNVRLVPGVTAPVWGSLALKAHFGSEMPESYHLETAAELPFPGGAYSSRPETGVGSLVPTTVGFPPRSRRMMYPSPPFPDRDGTGGFGLPMPPLALSQDPASVVTEVPESQMLPPDPPAPYPPWIVVALTSVE